MKMLTLSLARLKNSKVRLYAIKLPKREKRSNED